MSWISVAGIVVGTGLNLVGQNKQSKANDAALAANQSAVDKQNSAAWTSWLMSKGVQPTSPVAYGTVPTAGNFKAVNVRLPLWANVNVPTQNSGVTKSAPLFVKKGTV